MPRGFGANIHDDAATLGVDERTGHHLAGFELDRVDRAPVIATRAGQVLAGTLIQLSHRVQTGPHAATVVKRIGVRQPELL